MRLLDEHDTDGGGAKALLMVTHPGPSLLVTAVTIAAGGLARRAPPPGPLAVQLGLVMLPAQLAIGTANDLADRARDAVAKPYKPLVRGAVHTRTAIAIVVLGALVALATAATIGPAAVLVTGVGLGAGLGYDAGLKSTPASWLTWWAGFSALPLLAFVAAGEARRELLWVVPLAAPLSLGLHCANALPDLAADAAAGVRSTPVVLGVAGSSATALGSMIGVAVLAVLLPPGRGGGTALDVTALLCGAAAIAVGPIRGRPRARPPFAPLAVTAAVLATVWLATLPG